MFFVINKSKIYSYLIALCTVVALFLAAANLDDMMSTSKNTVETSTNILENSINTNSLKSE